MNKSYGLSYQLTHGKRQYRCFSTASELIKFVKMARCLSNWANDARAIVFDYNKPEGDRLHYIHLSH